MLCFYATLVTMATTAFGCSPPIGGFKRPTPAQKVSFAEHVVIGEVREIIAEDPLQNNFDTTYGAKVFVQCTYKGSPLPGFITIGGAGYIPGHCTAKELKADQKYLLFLTETRSLNNETLYEQSAVPEPSRNVTNFLDVCEVSMIYPEENGFGLKRRVCDRETDGPCQKYNKETGKTESVLTRSSTPPKKGKGRKEIVSVKMEDQQIKSTTENPGNGSCGFSVSFGLVLLSFLSTIF